jgi:hypothetical protein
MDPGAAMRSVRYGVAAEWPGVRAEPGGPDVPVMTTTGATLRRHAR